MTNRQFSSGANRNSEDGKLDFEGFLSPSVLVEFAEYMHKHRKLSDGTMRDSDNWQQGMPREVLMKSLMRHVIDLWMIHRERDYYRHETGEAVELQEALGGLMFNVMAYWHEVVLNRNVT